MSYLPATYTPAWNYSGVGQQVYPQYQQSAALQQPQPQQQTPAGLIWVDGEVGAKAFQMPQGWPANQPIALWDTNDTVIYLKSTNPMGMPNPLQKAHYTLEGTKSGEADRGFSGSAVDERKEYVTKDDLNKMKQDLMDALNGMTSGKHEQKEAET